MGLGWKRWTRERLTAADLNGYVQDQVVAVFASASARDAAIVAPELGMHAWLITPGVLTAYERINGAAAAWHPKTRLRVAARAQLPTTGVHGMLALDDAGQEWEWRTINGTAQWTWPRSAQGEIGRAEFGGRADLAIPVATLTAFSIGETYVPAGRKLEISFTGSGQVGDASTVYGMVVNQDGTAVRRVGLANHMGNTPGPIATTRTLTTGVGAAHTWTVQAGRLAGAGTGTIIGDGLEGPMQLSVRDLGGV